MTLRTASLIKISCRFLTPSLPLHLHPPLPRQLQDPAFFRMSGLLAVRQLCLSIRVTVRCWCFATTGGTKKQEEVGVDIGFLQLKLPAIYTQYLKNRIKAKSAGSSKWLGMDKSVIIICFHVPC